MVGRIVVGHNALFLDGIEHIEKAVQVEVAVEMRSGVPFRFKVDKQEVTRGDHLFIIEHEDRLHLSSGGICLRVQGLLILINREVEWGIKCLVLPGF